VYQEGGDRLRGGDPQPASLAGLFPAGFVDVLDGGLANRFERLFVGQRESLAHVLFQSGGRVQSNRDAEDVFGDFYEAAFADKMTASEIGERRRQPRADALSAEFGGNGGRGDFAAGEAGAAVALIFGGGVFG
jgi:hypothetical protein